MAVLLVALVATGIAEAPLGAGKVTGPGLAHHPAPAATPTRRHVRPPRSC